MTLKTRAIEFVTALLSCLFLALIITQLSAQQKPSPPKGLQPYTETIATTMVKFDMVPIPAGTFTVADPTKKGAKRQVKIKRFWMGKTEVTWDEYDVFHVGLDLTEEQKALGLDAVSRPSPPYSAPDHGWGHQGYPAIHLTYYAAEQYCKWLSNKTRKKYRLPTEAEWEYACRAGVWKTDPVKNLDQYAWYAENSEEKIHPVGKKAPNDWGLYDVLGNAGEWCAGLDGKPVLRGGSFNDSANKVHPGLRQLQTPDWQASDPQFPKGKWWLSDAPFAGFRIVREE